jgi:hypothetical protein
VLDRALGRVVNPAHRRAAIHRRRQTLAALGDLAYEREDMARARHFFRQAGRPVGSGLLRYVAASLPPFVRRGARVCWRRFHAAVSA